MEVIKVKAPFVVYIAILIKNSAIILLFIAPSLYILKIMVTFYQQKIGSDKTLESFRILMWNEMSSQG